MNRHTKKTRHETKTKDEIGEQTKKCRREDGKLDDTRKLQCRNQETPKRR